MTRSLTLKRETLAELTSDDLAAVGGAGQETVTCYLVRQITYAFRCYTPLCPTE